MKICINSYPAIDGAICKDGYVMEIGADGMAICIKRYDAKPSMCPQGFLLNTQRMCEKIVESVCPSPEPSPMHPYDPLPSIDAQVTSSAPLPSLDVQITPSATPCLRICPASNETFIGSAGVYSQWLQSQFVNGSCFYNVLVGSYGGCDLKGEFHPETNSCWYYYDATATSSVSTTGCQLGYQIFQWNGKLICLKQTEVIYVACPIDYKVVEYMGQRGCVKKVDAVCVDNSASPYRTASPSMTGKVAAPSSARTASMTGTVSRTPSTSVKIVERSQSASMTPKMSSNVMVDRSQSASMTPKIIDTIAVERSQSASMTPKVVDVIVVERSQSASMTPKIIDTIAVERSQSASMTPKVIDTIAVERSQSASMTPKVIDTIAVERSQSASMTPKVVDVIAVERSQSASMTPKVTDVILERSQSASMTPKVADVIAVERSQSASMTPKVADVIAVERSQSASMTPASSGLPCFEWRCRNGVIPVHNPYDTPICIYNKYKATADEKGNYNCPDGGKPSSDGYCYVSENAFNVPCETPTSSLTARPSNVEVLDVTNKPVEIVATKKPNCNIWLCPKDFSLAIVNERTVCKYYKPADYNIINLPDHVEGTPGGSYNEYFCPTGTKMITLQGRPESERFYCEGYADAKWLSCPTQSPRIRTPITFPSPIYKTQVARTAGPSRKPLFYQSSLVFNGAIADALVNPKVIKKLVIGLSCSVNDIPSTIKIKEICKKGNETVCIPFAVPEIEDVLVDCKRMYPSATPTRTIYKEIVVPYFRQLQVDASSTVEVKYEYTPTDTAIVPATVNVNDSPVLSEVALDISLTDSPSEMVAYSMTTTLITSTGGDASSASGTADNVSAISTASRNAIIGIVVGCIAMGAIVIAGMMGYRKSKRERREKMMTANVTQNPAVIDVVPSGNERWAFPPQVV
jgi:hypothetical protein